MSADVFIIGNGLVDADIADDVDAAGSVVRFNAAPNYGRKTGTRCDVLALNNTGSWARRLGRDGFLRGRPFTAACTTILFPRPAHPSWKQAALRLANRTWRLEYSRRILAANGLLEKEVVYLPRGFAAECLRMLLDQGRPRVRARVPSTGFLVLEHYLRTREDASIAVVGFAFEGWKRHPFELERVVVERYAREGRLRLVGAAGPARRPTRAMQSQSQKKRTV